MRWDGARQPVIWVVPRPDVDPAEARLELARRFLHIFGPGTPAGFAKWAGIKAPGGHVAFDALEGSLTPARTPVGDRWILTEDEATLGAPVAVPGGARLLPSGDAYFLLWGSDRELLVPEPERRRLLWTTRVWPGAILVNGEIVGTWRRATADLAIELWEPLPPAQREAVEAEAISLPLPGLTSGLKIRWVDLASAG
jgi:hypothetical protein